MKKPSFLWSRAGAGGTEALLEALLENAVRGNKCFWVVPEPYSHATERLLAERGGAPVCLNAEVLTFRRLCDHILAEGGGLALPALDTGGRLLLLRRAVNAVRGQLASLNAVSAKQGFLNELLKTLDECKCYSITPQALERAGANAYGAASNRLFDLALIFSAFDMLCARPDGTGDTRPLDPRDRIALAAEVLKKSGFGKGVSVYVSYFASFTPQERLLLTRLSDNAASYTMVFCGSLTGHGFEPLRATARQFAAHYPQGVAHITVNRPEENRSPALRHMEQTWFERKPPACPSDGSVELWSAKSEAAEVRFAAERIVELVRDEGLRWRDITVAASDYSAYGPLVESIFLQYGIPVFADSMDDMAKKPLSRLIRAAADCALYAYRPSDVVSLLRTGLLPVCGADADLMENYLRRWNPRGNRFSGTTDWSRPPGGYHGEPTEKEKEELLRLNTLRRFIANGVKKLSGGHTARQCAKNLFEAMTALDVPEGIKRRERDLLSAGEKKLADECGQMWQLFCKSLDQCVALLCGEDMDYGEFCELCLLVLSGYTVGSIPSSLDRVHAGDQGRLARITVPVVVYLGAGCDKIPARAGEGGLLAAEERAALNAEGCELPPDPYARIEREIYNLYSICTLPEKKLVLTYTATPGAKPGEDGRAECVGRLSSLFSLPVKPVPPPKYPGRALRKPDTALSPQSAGLLYGNTISLSATKIESFSRCPFAFFMRYGLRAEARPEPGFSPLDVGRELHAVLEKCARYAKERGGFHNLSREDMERFALELARDSDVLRRGGVATPRLLAQGERLAKTAAMLAGRMWDEFTHSLFEPLDFELYLEEEAKRLKNTPPGAPAFYKMRGFADRADGYRQGDTLFLRIVDYKSGKKAFSLPEVYHGLGAQMPLYLFMLQRLAPQRYNIPHAQAAGVLYVPSHAAALRSDRPLSEIEAQTLQNDALRHSGLLLDDKDILEAMDSRLYEQNSALPVMFNKDLSFQKRALVASPEQMERLREHIERLSSRTAQDIACGRAEASPLDKRERACAFCDYRAACVFDEEGERPMRGFSGRDDFFSALE